MINRKFIFGLLILAAITFTAKRWASTGANKSEAVALPKKPTPAENERATGKNIPNPSPASEKQTQPDRDEWMQYASGNIAYTNLSTANQRRADRKEEITTDAERKKRREKIREDDLRNGQNIEVWAKEDELRRRAESLYQGMTQARILEVMGTPSKIGQTMERIDESNSKKHLPTVYPEEFKVPNSRAYTTTIWQGIEATEKLPITGPKEAETVFIFSPHPENKLNYSVGDRFHYLQVWCNNRDGTVVAWQWTKPTTTF